MERPPHLRLTTPQVKRTRGSQRSHAPALERIIIEYMRAQCKKLLPSATKLEAQQAQLRPSLSQANAQTIMHARTQTHTHSLNTQTDLAAHLCPCHRQRNQKHQGLQITSNLGHSLASSLQTGQCRKRNYVWRQGVGWPEGS